MEFEYSDTKFNFENCHTQREKVIHIILVHVGLFNFDFAMYSQVLHMYRIKQKVRD